MCQSVRRNVSADRREELTFSPGNEGFLAATHFSGPKLPLQSRPSADPPGIEVAGLPGTELADPSGGPLTMGPPEESGQGIHASVHGGKRVLVALPQDTPPAT